ncbi:hypothetical protein MNEG_10286, partial [Monoraphidium neglectum]
EEARRLHLGRPDLARLVSNWLAALRQLPASSAADVSREGRGGPLQVGCYAMGPSGLLSQAQLLCHDLNSGRGGSKGAAGWAAAKGPGGGGGGRGRGVFMRYVCRTHNL